MMKTLQWLKENPVVVFHICLCITGLVLLAVLVALGHGG